MGWLSESERRTLQAAADDLFPAGTDLTAAPGAVACGVVDYIDGLLDAFAWDPPRIFAGGPFSGRYGGSPGFARFLPLGRLEEIAWRTRIEGSLGRSERERLGPVRGWQQVYREGLAALGEDFAAVPAADRAARFQQAAELRDLLVVHCCEGMYAAPEYGGNRGLAGWRAIGHPGDVLPRGWTDDEVSMPVELFLPGP